MPPVRGELIRAEQPFWARHGVWLRHDPIANDTDFAAIQERQVRRWAASTLYLGAALINSR